MKWKLLLILFLSGCSLFKASSIPSSGFIPDEDKLTDLRSRAPFNAAYIVDTKRLDLLKELYKDFYIAEVNIQPYQARLKREGVSGEELENKLEEASELANYLQQRTILEFRNKGLNVLEEPNENCFIWEIAISDLRPTLGLLNASATAAGFFVPGAGLLKRFATGSIAIEGIIRDGKNGDVLAAFKDRESDKESLFTVRDFQKYSHARYIIDDWAEQFAELSATANTVQVEDSYPITLSPF